MNDYERELGQLQAAVESLCTAFAEFRAESRAWQERFDARTHATLEAHAARIRSLELWRSLLAGALMALAALWGGLTELLRGLTELLRR